MYKPKIYTEKDKTKINKFIESYPFAQITGVNAAGKPVATQVPLIFNNKKNSLQGHLMKNTDHHKTFLLNPAVLVVFTGPSAYISGSWYNKPNVASTWNYMSVQVQGKLYFLNEDRFIEFMKRFTLKFESGNKSSPTFYDNIPEDYRKQHMQAIAGFEINIEKIDATFKLSQDKDEESFDNIIKQLKQKTYKEQWLADEMKENRKNLK
jgi:transcriptional regulator